MVNPFPFDFDNEDDYLEEMNSRFALDDFDRVSYDCDPDRHERYEFERRYERYEDTDIVEEDEDETQWDIQNHQHDADDVLPF